MNSSSDSPKGVPMLLWIKVAQTLGEAVPVICQDWSVSEAFWKVDKTSGYNLRLNHIVWLGRKCLGRGLEFLDHFSVTWCTQEEILDLKTSSQQRKCRMQGHSRKGNMSTIHCPGSTRSANIAIAFPASSIKTSPMSLAWYPSVLSYK